jgi:hypothetical protein
MSEFIIRPGDTVICIDDQLPEKPTALHAMVRDRLTEGAIYWVTDVVWLYGEKGLHLAGLDHRPTDGWRSCRFRKVLDSEDEVRSHRCMTARGTPADARAPT